jgi:hypothetical protein
MVAQALQMHAVQIENSEPARIALGGFEQIARMAADDRFRPLTRHWHLLGCVSATTPRSPGQ